MKLFKIAFAAVFALASGHAYAFHSGGVAECEGCHTMHNSFEGKPVQAGEGTGVDMGRALGLQQYESGPFLLKGSDQSSACLNCHNYKDTQPSGYHISTDASLLAPGLPPVEMTPGGDFAWLKKTYNVTIRGTVSVNGNDGERHGHNIIARDFGYEMDGVQVKSPGGNYPRENLHCSSCHDPHGRYRRFADGSIDKTGLPIFNSGSYNNSAAPTANVSAVGVYRFLGGVGYQPKSVTGNVAFTAPPPAAVAPSTYNRSEETIQTYVAYGSGMSEWCGNCHGRMHMDSYVSGQAKLVHPAGNGATITAPIATNYLQYVSSGIMTNADRAKAYSTLAPFEQQGAGTYSGASTTGANNQYYANLQVKATLDPTVDRAPSTSNTVMCLSCHRAHASGFESMTRYFLLNEFMTTADSTTNAAKYDDSVTENKINQGYNVAEQQAAYYNRPATAFGPNARNYCNKCHAKD